MKTLNKIALVALTLIAATESIEAGCRGGRCGIRRPAITRRAVAKKAAKPAVKKAAKPAPRRGGCRGGRCRL